MSDTAQGPGWWLASDGKWYPPEQHPAPPPPPQASTPRTPHGNRPWYQVWYWWLLIAIGVVIAAVVVGVAVSRSGSSASYDNGYHYGYYVNTAPSGLGADISPKDSCDAAQGNPQYGVMDLSKAWLDGCIAGSNDADNLRPYHP